MTASAQGRDYSAYQPVLTAADLDGLDFAFCKATNGLTADPHFVTNWQVTGTKGIHRGAYHELVPASTASAKAQADRFLAVVNAAGGAEPGTMLAVVASDYAGVTGAEVLAFCDAVHAAEPHCATLVYSDLDFLPHLTGCTAYDLWVAWPSGAAPSAAQIKPFTRWCLWQWGQADGTDQDAYDGSPAEMTTWLKSVAATAKIIHWRVVGPDTLAGAAKRHHTTPHLMLVAARRSGHVYEGEMARYIDRRDWDAHLPLGTELFAYET